MMIKVKYRDNNGDTEFENIDSRLKEKLQVSKVVRICLSGAYFVASICFVWSSRAKARRYKDEMIIIKVEKTNISARQLFSRKIEIFKCWPSSSHETFYDRSCHRDCFPTHDLW